MNIMLISRKLSNYVLCRQFGFNKRNLIKYGSNGMSKNGNVFNKLTMDNLDMKDKRVLMRVDFNVPIKDGKISDNKRIVAAVDSIKYALKKQAKCVILISHLGRPNGQKKNEFSLRPVAKELKNILNRDVIFVSDCIGPEVEKNISNASQGSVILLENLRFYGEEEGKSLDVKGNKIKVGNKKIKEFRQQLAKLGDIYVNDAFGAAHRAHSSMLGEGYDKRAAGFLLSKELKYFSQVLHNPRRPLLVILGGAKVSDKLPLIMNLMDKVDNMIIGGGMTFTFLKVINDMKIGNSLFDKKGAELINIIMDKACHRNVEIYLPVDFVCGTKIAEDAEICNATVETGIPNNYIGVDIGSCTRILFQEPICKANTIVWNGWDPLGVFEIDTFSQGSKAVMDAVVSATTKGSTSILCGGDTAACSAKFETVHKVSHVSTGGGAALELLEGKNLPGVKALSTL